MFVKKTFALILATAALLAPSVHGGFIRGASKENETTMNKRRRSLKENMNMNVAQVQTPAVPAAPVAPPPPVAPPAPSELDLFRQNCVSPQLENCVRSTFANLEGCTLCIFSLAGLNTVSENGIRACGKFQCGRCIDQAIDVYECGLGVPSVPVPVPVVPIPAVPLPAFPVPADPVPADPVPAVPVPAVPVPVDPVPAVPVPAVPVPADPVVDTSVCSATVPSSGDRCETGGAPWVYCCYGFSNLPASEALVCSCLDGDNRYLCHTSSNARCSTIIRAEGDPVSAPVPNPDPEPVVPEPVVPEPVVPEPVVPEPVVPEPVVPEPVPNPNIPEFCLALTGIPRNGTSCEGVLPDDIQTGGCGGEIIAIGEDGLPVNVTRASCSCDKANPIWMCTEIIETRAPTEAPPDEGPAPIPGDLCDIPTPSTGDSCSSNLVLTIDYLQCTFMQFETDSNNMMTGAEISCECDSRGSANPADTTWVCDGTLPPISDPTLMPAGEAQPISMEPVPVVPVPAGPVEPTCPPQGSPPDTGESCDGVLPGILSSATCNYSTTVTQNSMTTVYQKACTCRASTGLWSCTGGIPEPEELPAPVPEPEELPAPVTDQVTDPVLAPEPVTVTDSVPDAVPDPIADPVVETASFSEWACRPLGSGCSAPHTVPSDCSGTASCCPGSIITDWRTNDLTCEHN